jgi:hypothetical protein
MPSDQFIDRRVAGRIRHILDRRAGMEQGLDGIRRPPLPPVRVDARAHRERERRASLPIARVDRRAALDEHAYRLVPGTPGGDMERGAVRRDSEVRVALVQSVDSHSELQEATDASRVGRARELGAQRAALLHQPSATAVLIGRFPGVDGSARSRRGSAARAAVTPR